MDILKNLLLILAVILSFNVMIFVHELGHFLAARWRGLKIEKFQVWFGKPIWSKTINGVQYGLGWIPAGGFVALPQLAPMETIEGKSENDDEPLPPISPLDKIIVAVAGPIFSLGLALVLGLAVWGLGKPQDLIHATQIGYIKKNGPAEKAGLQLGDTILAINDKPVIGFAGNLDCITESIVLSDGDDIKFTIRREGESEPRTIFSSFETQPTAWYQRRALRQVGISYTNAAVVEATLPHSPAAKAGLETGDRITAIDGTRIWSTAQVGQIMEAKNYQEVKATVLRGESALEIALKPAAPLTPANERPMLGIGWSGDGIFDTHIVHPNPIRQCKDSVKMLVATIKALVSRKSSVGIDQLSSPIGIAKAKYDLLSTDENGWRRLLVFLVLINVNLAIFNMLPFPVLDGGHTTLAIMEWVARRPVKARVLEYVQSACALVLISLFLYITSKDIGGFFGPKEKIEKVTFAP
jgi:regulator of sigma E protease